MDQNKNVPPLEKLEILQGTKYVKIIDVRMP